MIILNGRMLCKNINFIVKHFVAVGLMAISTEMYAKKEEVNGPELKALVIRWNIYMCMTDD